MHTILRSLWPSRIVAMLAGALAAMLPFAAAAQDCPFPCFNGGGIGAGVFLAGGINGLLRGDPDTLITSVMDRVIVFLGLAAFVVIVIAGFFLILGLGEESSRDRAKRIILYTIVGIFVVIFARLIVDFVFYLAGQKDTNIDSVIRSILDRILLFLALICVIVIIIAGFYLILGLGEESSKDKAKRIILYTVIGLAIILLAQQIVDLMFYLIDGRYGEGSARAAIVDIVRRVLNFLALIAVITIIIAGFVLVLSLGNEEQKDRAKRIIIYTLIGLLVVLFSRVIVEITIYFFSSQWTVIRS